MSDKEQRDLLENDGEQVDCDENTVKEITGVLGGGSSVRKSVVALAARAAPRKRRATLLKSAASKQVSSMEQRKDSKALLWPAATQEETTGEDSVMEVEEANVMGPVESNKRRRPHNLAGLSRGEDYPVDSVPCMIYELEQLLEYVASRPKLRDGSASFMRDNLRTLLMVSSNAASAQLARNVKNGTAPNSSIEELPHELIRHVFSFLDGPDLNNVRLVCRRWNIFACEEPFWKNLCLRLWPSLRTDEGTWKLIDENISLDDPHRWRKIYPKVANRPRWKCRLQKTGKFICNLNAHQILGPDLGEEGLPYTLVVERRFNILHLRNFVLPNATILYFEPVTPQDRPGFEQFIEYLVKRTRAGLALERERRFIFVPPCEYSRVDVKYHGNSLLGVVQVQFPPLQN